MLARESSEETGDPPEARLGTELKGRDEAPGSALRGNADCRDPSGTAWSGLPAGFAIGRLEERDWTLGTLPRRPPTGFDATEAGF